MSIEFLFAFHFTVQIKQWNVWRRLNEYYYFGKENFFCQPLILTDLF